MQIFTQQDLVDAAAAWFGSLGHWPAESVADTARGLHAAKIEGAAYYGVQAVMLMLVAGHDGHWPPMSPSNFAREIPAMGDDVARYAKNIATVELRREQHNHP